MPNFVPFKNYSLRMIDQLVASHGKRPANPS